MAKENIVAALDIGTTKILALVGEMDEHGDIHVIGHGVSAAEGLRRGVVVDMDKTVKSIRKAIDDAQLVSGVLIDRVSVGIAGEHIYSINSHGVVAVSRSDNEITAADVKRAVDAARTIAIPVDREIIHVIPQEYSVDDQTGVHDPVGMNGVRLEVEVHIVTASVTSARNIYRALERCRLGVDHMLLESLAMAEVITTPQEISSGCVLIDIGGDITNLSVFFESTIRHTAVVGLGGRNVTSDIAIGLRLTVEQAEALKCTHGAALASSVDASETIVIPSAIDRSSRDISRHVLASIIEPRMEEIFSLIAKELKKAVRPDLFASGLILTGGGALLPGTIELAEQMFDLPVRLGQLRKFASTPDDLNTSRFVTAHGLLHYGFHHEPEQMAGHGAARRILRRFENWITRQF
jgi:cell division protein FtsA